MTLTNVSDIENRWRPLTDDEAVVATTRLADAERRIAARIPNFDQRVEDDNGFVNNVVEVASSAVIRILLNPDGKRSESIDDYSWTRDRAVSDGILRITPEEWALLGVSRGGRKAFTIDTTPSRRR